MHVPMPTPIPMPTPLLSLSYQHMMQHIRQGTLRYSAATQAQRRRVEVSSLKQCAKTYEIRRTPTPVRVTEALQAAVLEGVARPARARAGLLLAWDLKYRSRPHHNRRGAAPGGHPGGWLCARGGRRRNSGSLGAQRRRGTRGATQSERGPRVVACCESARRWNASETAPLVRLERHPFPIRAGMLRAAPINPQRGK